MRRSKCLNIQMYVYPLTLLEWKSASLFSLSRYRLYSLRNFLVSPEPIEYSLNSMSNIAVGKVVGQSR